MNSRRLIYRITDLKGVAFVSKSTHAANNRRLKPSAIHDSTEDILKRAEARETFLPQFVTGIAEGKEAQDAHYKARLRDASEGGAVS